MDAELSGGPRKALRVGHVTERGAVNAVRTLLEAAELVVVEVDARSDYGRDLIVDITEGSEITGDVIAVQVKGRGKLGPADDWTLRTSAKDLTFWKASSVPIVGVLWSAQTGGMRWANLSSHARTDPNVSVWSGHGRGPAHDPSVVHFPPDQQLSSASLDNMLSSMRLYLRQASSPALLGLFDGDEERRRQAIFDCWTLGRADARAFRLLRRALPELDGWALRDAIAVLSHLTPHPDIFWHRGNWVPPEIEADALATFSWSSFEIFYLVDGIERLDDGPGWERGGIGQCLWMILSQDKKLRDKTLAAIGVALDHGRLSTAVRLLGIHQYVAVDPPDAAREAIHLHFGLLEHRFTSELLAEIDRLGWVDIF